MLSPKYFASLSISTSSKELQNQLWAAGEKPIVIGIYGVSGCGKTHLMKGLKFDLGEIYYSFYDDSEAIDKVVKGGINAYKKLDDNSKTLRRMEAIVAIRNECSNTGRIGVFAGHYMFWDESEATGRLVWTNEDKRTYTHIIYLQVSPNMILSQRQVDLNKGNRTRPQETSDHVKKLQHAEIDALRSTCMNNDILFTVINSPSQSAFLPKSLELLDDFRRHSSKINEIRARNRLDHIISSEPPPEKFIVLDGDKTLTAQDTGPMFFHKSPKSLNFSNPLKTVFGSPMKYSYQAFRQAMLLHHELAGEVLFEEICTKVAAEVIVRPEFVRLLEAASIQKHTKAYLSKKGSFVNKVHVIGGGLLSNGFVVAPSVKGNLVKHMRTKFGAPVWAFGDSVLDLEMMKEASHAIVVVGDEKTRSKIMEAALHTALEKGLVARQVLLPSTVSPRLNTNILPIFRLDDPQFVSELFARSDQVEVGDQVNVTHQIKVTVAKMHVAKLLQTPMRDAAYSGSLLREAHRRVGWYLATEFLSTIIGTEQYPIVNVQHVNGTADGYRFKEENSITVVALMRGGEPMAFGVSDAMPLAMFVHAHHPHDLKPAHLEGQHTVILVDSVINSGTTIIEFHKRVRSLEPGIRVLVICGVMQNQSSQALRVGIGADKSLEVVALRMSDNKFTGWGTTDTGNRLYNTTHIP